MNTRLLASVLTAGLLLAGCNKSPNITSGSPQIQAEPFHGQVYRSFDGRDVLTLISKDECELNGGGTILLCKYTKQSEALRVVVTSMGTNQVVYFRVTDQGLQGNNGSVLLAPGPYAAAIEQARVARENEARVRMEAEQKRIAEERRKQDDHNARSAKYLDWFRTSFAKGTKHTGNYHGDSPMTFTVSEAPEISTKERNEVEFQAVGTIHWNGKMRDTVANTDAVQDHRVHLGGTISMPDDNKFYAYLSLYWYHPRENRFITTGDACWLRGFQWETSNADYTYRFDNPPAPDSNK